MIFHQIANVLSPLLGNVALGAEHNANVGGVIFVVGINIFAISMHHMGFWLQFYFVKSFHTNDCEILGFHLATRSSIWRQGRPLASYWQSRG